MVFEDASRNSSRQGALWGQSTVLTVLILSFLFVPTFAQTGAPEQFNSSSSSSSSSSDGFELDLPQKVFIIAGVFVIMMCAGLCYCTYRYNAYAVEDMKSHEAFAQSLEHDVNTVEILLGASPGERTDLNMSRSGHNASSRSSERRGSLVVVNSGSSGVEPRGSGSSGLSGKSLTHYDAADISTSSHLAPPSRKKKGVTFEGARGAGVERAETEDGSALVSHLSGIPLPPLHPKAKGVGMPLQYVEFFFCQNIVRV